MNHLLSDRRPDAHLVSLGILFHDVPIRNERVGKCDDVNVTQISHVVTASEIRRPFWFACFDPFLGVRDRESNPKSPQRWFRANDFIGKDLLRCEIRSRKRLVQLYEIWHGQSPSSKFVVAEPSGTILS